MIRIYNTLTRKKEEFVPIEKNEIKMYVCGPTVYDLFHIGNARTFIVFDTIRRYFEFKGFNVIFVQNFTDIDDKMIKRANEESLDIRELGDKYIDEYYKDAKSINVKKATIAPRATEFIPEIIKFIEDLIKKGYAYEIDGDVYFSKNDYGIYGKLLTQNQDDLKIGARIDLDSRKKNPTDFVLWKSRKEGEPYYDSPFGKGRPGWHIECSVMANKLLGETIDIHGGGVDLKFPHHENEIAQSESRNNKKFANYWMHSAFVNIDKKKMAKSLRNFITTRHLVEQYGGNTVRLLMLSAHYRNQVEYSKDLIESAKKSFERIENAYLNLKFLEKNLVQESDINKNDIYVKKLEKIENEFTKKMDDDFNTADAISVIFDLIKEVNINIDENSSKQMICLSKEMILKLTNVLGFVLESDDNIDEEIEDLIRKRNKARESKDFKTSDLIRDKLLEMGIIIEDTPSGTKFKKK